MLWTAFITPVVHQSSRYGLEPIVWLQQWALILVLYNVARMLDLIFKINSAKPCYSGSSCGQTFVFCWQFKLIDNLWYLRDRPPPGAACCNYSQSDAKLSRLYPRLLTLRVINRMNSPNNHHLNVAPSPRPLPSHPSPPPPLPTPSSIILSTDGCSYWMPDPSNAFRCEPWNVNLSLCLLVSPS